ncbi:MAG: outer membrane beta-barrel protein [Bacteroidota bacterium]
MTIKKLNLFVLAFLLIGNLTLIAQDDNQQASNSKTQDKRTHNIDDDEDFERRWKNTPNRYHNWGINFGGDWDNDWNDNLRVGLLDIGFSTYFHDGSLNLPAELDAFDQRYGGSLNLNLHLIRHRVPLFKDNFGIEYGLSVAWKQYRFSNDFRILEDATTFTTEDDGTTYRKNKLKTTFLEVPLMLTLSPNGRRSNFYLSGGIYGNVLLGAKQKLRDNNGNTTKIKDDFNLNKFRYGFIGRIGFGPIALYAQLSATELFKTGQGPELYPFNIGISLLDF